MIWVWLLLMVHLAQAGDTCEVCVKVLGDLQTIFKEKGSMDKVKGGEALESYCNRKPMGRSDAKIVRNILQDLTT